MPSAYSAGLQYRECFAQAGYEAEFVALDQPSGFVLRNGVANRAWRAGLKAASRSMKADIVRRWNDRIVEMAASFDVVYSLKVPSLEFHERIIALRRPRLLFVFADAFWLPFARRGPWRDLNAILTIADGVLCVNEFTAAHARARNPRVFLMDDSPQTEDFDAYRGSTARDSAHTTLGWIGSPTTAQSLFRIWEPLEDLAAEFDDLRLRIVGSGPSSLLNIPRFERLQWSSLAEYDHEAMIREVLAMDIGLFPVFRGDDARARGALKATIYMSGEAAVVAQRYAENPSLIQDGTDGMLCSTDEEWYAKIRHLVLNPEERRAMARRGLELVRRRFSRAATFEQLRHAIDNV